MDAHCLSFKEIPHTSALFLDYLYQFARLAPFYSHDPSADESFPAAARSIQIEKARREAVADVLAEQAARFGAGEETQRNIVLLRQGKALVVVTGQQVGLFGGPAYSAYKAITAIALARRLTANGLVAVPVFWLASEDHDFAEVNQVEFLATPSEGLALRDPSTPTADTPVGPIVFAPAMEELRRRVIGLWPRELRSQAEELLAGYAPGGTYARAFGQLFQQLFSREGLILLNPMHPTLHALSRPLFRRSLEEAGEVQTLLSARNRELEKAGYHAQVRLRQDATLLFLLADGKRQPIRRRGAGFAVAGRGEVSLDDLSQRLEAEPQEFSPNVLLRPLMQDFLLPTVATVAGPSEIAYYGQASTLYEKFLGRMPVIVPRMSVTLVEAPVRRLVERYGLSLADCFSAPPRLRARLAERRLSPRLRRRLEATERRLENLLVSTAEAVEQLDPTLRGAVETSRSKMLYQFHKIRAKAARAHAEREGIVDRHLNTLLTSLYPHRVLQERRYNFLGLVARHGAGLLPDLLALAGSRTVDHRVIFL